MTAPPGNSRRPLDELDLRIEFGRARMPAADIRALEAGDVITLDVPAEAPVELHAGGRLIARGQAVELDGRLCVCIRQIFPGFAGADSSTSHVASDA
jgi:flagellar motor switch protein FliN/FliY